ncbi:FKBP-type peptidyl-prolyl cis-trans isomerase [Brumimicrobium aurantiacum]|uniref:Peptidyl-prolyl cis-trans isomerase n=1 Tax=Brumimicrobium aurantiacum TaxID=1737063 RepID=A0A3E1EUK9_9FLAO|nr:FKBP-type peptidyl-prolyl cis-trans isomerase [Brumimicrobium aurantiacum]RFC53220.1 hypothetical protein DXU93_14225 [Brumimicrobium aurantiacum]
MRNLAWIVFLGLLISSCDIKGVDSDSNSDQTSKKYTSKSEEDTVKISHDESEIEPVETVVEEPSDTLKLNNGIKITYFKKGNGEQIKKDDVVLIDYRAKLEDGTVYDGNHRVKKKSIPFLVGWNQQTSGWDIALKELRVGDDVDIFLPAKYARGEKGIKGIVPPNANNIISMRVLEKMEPTSIVDGVKIWKYDQLKNPGDSIQTKDKVLINYWVSSESKPRYDNSYQRGAPFEMTIDDGNSISGLNKALKTAREGDRLLILVPSEEAFGKAGLAEMVGPGESIFYDVQVAKVE